MADYTMLQKGAQLDQNTTKCDITFATITERDAHDVTSGRTGIGKRCLVEVGDSGNKEYYKYTLSGWEADVVDVIDFNTSISTPTHKKGRVHWNDDEKTLEVGINDDGVILQVGREFLVQCCNKTASLIPNGKAVYISGVFEGCPTIELANSNNYDKSRALGVTTQDIAVDGKGEVTKIGLVRGVDTSSLSTGTIYLSSSIDGDFTNTPPVGGAFKASMGNVLISDATVGVIFVSIENSELSVEVTGTNGFPLNEKDKLTLSFTDATRLFSITSSTGDYHFYENGNKFEKTTSESVNITDEEGGHLVYYEDGVLTTSHNPTSQEVRDIILNNCIVSYIYWNATDNESVFVGQELHGISMSPQTHVYLHETQGTQYLSGMALSDVVSDGDGGLDVSAQFGIGLGRMADEDNEILTPTIASTVGFPVYYLDGATPNLRKDTNLGFSMLTTGTGRLAYNEWTGSVWQVSEVPERDFALIHIFALNGIEGGDKIISIMGQNEYANTSSARAGAEAELSSLLNVLPVPEMVPIATFILETRNAFDNTVKSRVRTTDDGEDFIDWRQTSLQAGASPTDHNNLAGLNTTSSDETYMHVTNLEPFHLPSFTTVERDLFIPNKRMMIYNSTTDTTQKYNGTVWVDF